MEEVYGTFNNNGNGKKMGALQKKSYNILYKHYFSVELYGVLPESGLLNISEVIPYLQQNLPVPFADEFVWGSLIKQKLAQMNIDLAEYNIELETDLEATSVCKPYQNRILADRIRKINDFISDINFVVRRNQFFRDYT